MTRVATIRHRAALSGRVVDALTGLGVGAAEVRVAAIGRVTRARADGSFGLIDLADGSYDLSASAPALGSRYGSVTVIGVMVAREPDGRPRLTLTDLALPPTRLSGRVRRADTLAAVQRAEVRLRASALTVVADGSGAFEFHAVEAGAQTAVVSAPGFVTLTARVELIRGQAVAVDFDLTPV